MAYKYENKINEAFFIAGRDGRNVNIELLVELQQVYNKAKAFDELKKHVDEEGGSYMALYRQTKDPIYSLLNSHYDTLLGFIEELERE